MLRDIHGTYKEDPARVGRASAALVNAVRARIEAGGGGGGAAAAGRPAPSLIGDTLTVFKRLFDDRDGGAATRAQVSLEHPDPSAVARARARAATASR